MNGHLDKYKGVFIFIFAGFCYFFAPQSMSEPARRVLFVFVAAALFWALEIIPLYATSLGVVILLTFLLCRPDGILGMDAAGYQVFMLPFGSPVIMLFFGGLVLAQALGKYHLDQMIATRLLRMFGARPLMVMWGFMLVTAFLSMWMSNTATTAMMIAMILPLVKQMDAGDPFRTALVLSIPFAANIGGIATPIGTPPNAIAMGILANEGIRVSFLAWMKMATPLALLLLIVICLVLFKLFPSNNKTLKFQFNTVYGLNRRGRMVIVIAIFTVMLWLTSEIHKIPSALIALSAAGLLAVNSLLDREDFNRVDWDVLILMWGGLALGKAMEISGLSQWIVGLSWFSQEGVILILFFSLLAVILSTFMSNTATANLVIPVAMAIPGQNHILLTATIALSCSFAMALPISTPPNAIAFASNMIKSKDMIKAGVLVSVVSVFLLLIGYQTMIIGTLGKG